MKNSIDFSLNYVIRSKWWVKLRTIIKITECERLRVIPKLLYIQLYLCFCIVLYVQSKLFRTGRFCGRRLKGYRLKTLSIVLIHVT